MSVGSHDLVEFALAMVGGALAVWVVFRACRFQAKLFRSRGWPLVPGTVQKGEVLQRGATTILHVPFRSLLGYAYKVDGKPYWGLFAFFAEDGYTAEKLQGQAEGQSVNVRYNPKAPEESLLETKELLGRKVIQDPFYLDNSN